MTKQEQATQYDVLKNIARKIVHDAEDAGSRLSSSLLASPMMDELDPSHITPTLAAFSAHCHCVQVLGEVLRYEYGTSKNPQGERTTDQMEFKEFGSRLQARYPVLRGEETNDYVPLADLTAQELESIENRLNVVQNTYQEHRDQIRRYRLQKFSH